MATNSVFRRFSKKIERGCKRIFYHLGYFIAGRPISTIIVCILLTGLFSVGLTQLFNENRWFKLFVPQNTIALAHKEWVESQFVEGTRPAVLVFRSKEQNHDISTKLHLQEMIQVLRATEKTIGVLGSKQIKLQDFCVQQGNGMTSHCLINSVLDLFFDPHMILFNKDLTYLDAVEAKLRTLSDLEIKQTISKTPHKTWTTREMAGKDFMSGVQGHNSTLSVEAFQVVLLLEERLVTKDGNAIDYEAESWETQWLANMNTPSIEGAGKLLTWNALAAVSFQDAAGGDIADDLKSVIVGYILLTLYVISFMGELHPVNSRVLLGFGALIGVGLAYLSTAGISSVFGLSNGPLHSVLPVLLLGIGMDDAFIVIACFDSADKDLHPRERVARAVSHAGSAILISSATNACAFYIASITCLPALESFALWAGTGILLDFIFQLTFFVALLTLDTQRQKENRYDVFVCCKRTKVHGRERNIFGFQPGVLSRWFENYFAKFVLWKPVKVISLVAAITFFGFSLYGLSLIKQDFQPEYFYLKDSYQEKFNDVHQQYFNSSGVSLFVYTGELDYASEATQEELNHLYRPSGLITSDPYIEDKNLLCWYPLFQHFTQVQDPLPRDEFYPALQKFLQSPYGTPFTRDLVFDNQTQTLQATRCRVSMASITSNYDELHRMQSIRESLSKSKLAKVFPYTPTFLFAEQYAVLDSEVRFNLFASIIIVFAISFSLIGNPLVATVVMVSVGLCVVDIMGLMYFCGIQFNSVSVIYLALALGLTIDSSLHLGLAFMEKVGTRTERTTAALRDLGPPLVHGILSTFLAISMVGFARSYIFAIFFKMFLMIFGLGFFHGMIIVPQILSLFGPRGYFDTQEEKEQSDAEVFIHNSKEKEKEQDTDSASIESPICLCAYEQV